MGRTVYIPKEANRDSVVTLRLSREDNVRLASRAEAIGCSKSDFLRILLRLPVEFTLESVALSAEDVVGIDRYESQVPGGEVLKVACPRVAVSMMDLRKLSGEVNRWGSNFNQIARAMNSCADLGKRTGFLSKSSKASARYLMDSAYKQAQTAYEGVRRIEEEVYKLADAEVVPIGVTIYTGRTVG